MVFSSFLALLLYAVVASAAPAEAEKGEKGEASSLSGQIIPQDGRFVNRKKQKTGLFFRNGTGAEKKKRP
jgi:hypothetical protein